MAKKLPLPRVPLPRQTGGAHRVTREELVREAIEETEAEDFYDYMASKLDDAGRDY